MSNNIPQIPEVPLEIKEAVNNRTLAVFIGAGVSRLVGCEGWDVLAKKLVCRCHNIGIINFKEHEVLLQIPDHKKTITICKNLFKNNDKEDTFYEEMCIALKEKKPVESPNIYNDIYKLRGLFLTTNVDTHFDGYFHPPNILYRDNDFRANSLDSTNLYHIHGSIKDKDSMIFTVSDYMKRYTNPNFRGFLTRIFGKYTVLFLGYGLGEFEILDFIFQGNNYGKNPRHFILSGFYSGENNILQYEQTYYNDLGINILGYNKDDRGYKQLIEILKKWNEEINQISRYLHVVSREIDKAVE